MDPQQQKILFGMKLRHYRMALDFSFQQLSDSTGISKSYLNEMEMGLKYPRTPKLLALAKALQVPSTQLTDAELPEALRPLTELMQSNFLQELPLDMMGLDLPKILAMLSQAPARVGAFIAALLELSRSYSSRESHFYFGALRSYLELNLNYFEALETTVLEFQQQEHFDLTQPPNSQQLAGVLLKNYNCTTVFNGLDAFPELKRLRGVFVSHNNTLLLRSDMSEGQKSFQLAKELGFQLLGLTDRAYTSRLLQFHTFEEVLNHFKAGYFAAALIVPQVTFTSELGAWLQQKTLQLSPIEGWLVKYSASPELLFQRMTNLLPHHFGVKELYFIRTSNQTEVSTIVLSKEMHLEKQKNWRSIGPEEHFCARRIGVKMLLAASPNASVGTLTFGVQLEIGEKDDTPFLCIGIAQQVSTNQVSVSTLGIRLSPAARTAISFSHDPALPVMQVNSSCERCPLTDCSVRLAPATLYLQKKERDAMKTALATLLKE